MNNRRWFVVVGNAVDEDGNRETSFTIVIAYTTDDVESWAAQRYDTYDIFPAGDFIVDLTRVDAK